MGNFEEAAIIITGASSGIGRATALAQADQAWMSEVVLRPLDLELRRTTEG